MYRIGKPFHTRSAIKSQQNKKQKQKLLLFSALSCSSFVLLLFLNWFMCGLLVIGAIFCIYYSSYSGFISCSSSNIKILDRHPKTQKHSLISFNTTQYVAMAQALDHDIYFFFCLILFLKKSVSLCFCFLCALLM